MKKNLKNKRKKSYQKPLIEEIDLKPEEAVLTGCKTFQGETGPATGNPICSTTGNVCKKLGS